MTVSRVQLFGEISIPEPTTLSQLKARIEQLSLDEHLSAVFGNSEVAIPSEHFVSTEKSWDDVAHGIFIFRSGGEGAWTFVRHQIWPGVNAFPAATYLQFRSEVQKMSAEILTLHHQFFITLARMGNGL